MESQNVFLTKSFWAPVAAFLVAKAAMVLQDWVQLTADDQTAIAGGFTVIVIAAVRAVTNRPAHFFKPKGDPNE